MTAASSDLFLTLSHDMISCTNTPVDTKLFNSELHTVTFNTGILYFAAFCEFKL